MATIEDFDKIDMRVGRVLSVEEFPEARNPAWKLEIDFGPEVGIKRSSAQIAHYTREQLLGRTVVGVILNDAAARYPDAAKMLDYAFGEKTRMTLAHRACLFLRITPALRAASGSPSDTQRSSRLIHGCHAVAANPTPAFSSSPER